MLIACAQLQKLKYYWVETVFIDTVFSEIFNKK